ncbi:transcriptional regulator with XRE-family HTH domain [Hoeflea marina]|uniref:Transcriptional regulator with XRE-family HTH domain n=1 Tax=Hoeflea marina TaxID=274592 RepID=A0A317PIX1_9HYPH|nr:helix-turn-helix transcriptional regulator [Hoeflea marina]PWW00539.1 transcriptional regulator with XRE-family HTH domain [Hoeflea marina]
MTPFGAAIRKLRTERGVTQRQMAAALGVSAAYLSALEHGHRSEPNWETVQRIIGFFNVIWDDAEELQRLASLSRPRVVIDTAGLSARATEIANRLSAGMRHLDEQALDELDRLLLSANPQDRRPPPDRHR